MWKRNEREKILVREFKMRCNKSSHLMIIFKFACVSNKNYLSSECRKGMYKTGTLNNCRNRPQLQQFMHKNSPERVCDEMCKISCFRKTVQWNLIHIDTCATLYIHMHIRCNNKPTLLWKWKSSRQQFLSHSVMAHTSNSIIIAILKMYIFDMACVNGKCAPREIYNPW